MTETMDINGFTRALSFRFLHFFVMRQPAICKSWGEAMLAELSAIPGGWDSISWSLGGSLVLSKNLLKSFFLGRRSGQAGMAGGDLGDRPPRAELVFLALALCMLLSPVFRQAIGTSLDGWRFPDTRSAGAREILAQVVKAAERQNDADSLAFVAIHTDDSVKSAQFAKRAIALDPQLTWILSELLVVRLDREMPELRADPDVRSWIADLERWDPGNALPYLLEAGKAQNSYVIAAMSGMNDRPLWSPDFPASRIHLEAQPARLAAMDRAYSTSRYDSYFERRLRLDRKVFQQSGIANPMLLTYLQFRDHNVFPAVALTQAEAYSNFLIAEADKQWKANNKSAAASSYRKVWQFGELIAGVPAWRRTPFEQYVGRGILFQGYRGMQKATTSAAEREDIAAMGKTLSASGWNFQQAEDEPVSLRWLFRLVEGPVNNIGKVVSISVAVLLFSFAATLFTITYFLSGRRRGVAPGMASRRRLAPFMMWAGQCASALLLLSSGVLYFSYLPYASAFRNYLNGGDPLAGGVSMRSFNSLAYVPYWVMQSLGGEAQIKLLLWYGVTLLAVPLLVLFLYRLIRSFQNKNDIRPAAL
ncbi:MAG TPA: hypothetical protein VKZ53_16035 [Candidatus Angelobacter sp.]|nr:hypothetical protein [Candidatus Angelobacter sp.]